MGNNKSNDTLLLSSIVTTYKRDSLGNTDTSWKYLNYVDTASVAGEYYFNNAKRDFAQTRLTNGGATSGYSIANEDTIRAAFLRYYDALSSTKYLALESGREARKYFDENLSISINLLSGVVTVNDISNMVSQLRTINILSQFGFSGQE